MKAKDEGGRMKDENGQAGSFLLSLRTSASSAVRHFTVWVRRNHLRVTTPQPHHLIGLVAKHQKLNVMILPGNLTEPMPTVRLVYMLAERAGLVVTLACPKTGWKETLNRKIIYSRRN